MYNSTKAHRIAERLERMGFSPMIGNEGDNVISISAELTGDPNQKKAADYNEYIIMRQTLNSKPIIGWFVPNGYDDMELFDLD